MAPIDYLMFVQCTQNATKLKFVLILGVAQLQLAGAENPRISKRA
jgi:hypothetical protein